MVLIRRVWKRGIGKSLIVSIPKGEDIYPGDYVEIIKRGSVKDES